jgi:cell division protein FtsQ
MPAALRGGSSSQAKPRVKAPPNSRQRTSAPKAGRISASSGGHGGLSPKWALAGAIGVLALALGATLATGHRGERIAQAAAGAVDGKFGQAGFRLRAVHVEGASPMATADIIKTAGIYRDQPLLGLNLNALRQRIESVGWVKDARVVRLLPDTLVIAVVERRQLAVWQHGGRSFVIDDHGKVIPEANAARFTTLPLVVGEGGAEHAPQILPIIAQRPKLMAQMDALVRVDDRRWDLRMKDGSLIQLPATGEDDALMQLERLDQRSRILELGFERIDLRNPDVVAVRPREAAPAGQLAAAGA